MIRRTIVTLELHERAILVVDGQPERALGPGRHVVWTFKPMAVVRYDTRLFVAEIPADHQALLDADDILTVEVENLERAVIRRRGRPVRVLGPGTWQVWTVEQVEKRVDGERVKVPAIAVDVLDCTGDAVIRDDLKAVMPAADHVEVLVPDGHVALRVVDGAVETELGPGRHVAWTVGRKVVFQVIDTREKVLAINGQEVMTRDKVTLRLNAAVTWKVHDARRHGQVARNAEEVVYLAAQLALREAIARLTLDELLAAREEIVAGITPAVAVRAEALGCAVLGVGMKDLILPGEMKTLLNRVMEAQKEAEANVILRREETAATRSLAQTAKVLAENPIVMRLKELEAYKELAERVGTLNIVMGPEGLARLELKG